MKLNDKSYKDEFSNYSAIIAEALSKEDIKSYEVASEMLAEAVEDYKKKVVLMEEMDTNNFGVLNHIFEDALPILFKGNKKAVKNVIKLIKEDSNLRSQFNFYNALRQYNNATAKHTSPSEYVEKVYELASKGIDKKSLSESNNKLRDMMFECGVSPQSLVSDADKEFYNNGNNLLSKKNTLSNMASILESVNGLSQYIDKKKGETLKEGNDLAQMLEDFEKKMKDTLNESEASLVKDITDFKNPLAEERKRKLFYKFKNECIDKVDEMIKENGETDELMSLRKQLSEQEFNNESIVKDIAKMLEVRDILFDK